MTPQMLSNTLECTRYQRSTTKQEVSTGDNAEAPACGLTHQASGVYIPYNDAVERPEPLLSRHFCALFLHLCHKLGSLCKRGAWTADGHRVHPRAHHHRLAGVIEVVVGARHELNGVQVAHTHACFSGGCQLDLRRGNRVAIVGHGGRARCTPPARMCASKYWHRLLLAHSQRDFQQPHGAKSGAALSGLFRRPSVEWRAFCRAKRTMFCAAFSDPRPAERNAHRNIRRTGLADHNECMSGA